MIRSLSRFSEREQSLAAAIALVLLGYLFFAGICEPQLLRLDAASAKLDAQERLLGLKRQAAALEIVSVKKREELVQEMEKLESGFFTEKEAARFLAGLSDLVVSTNCRLIQAAFVSEEKLEPRNEGDDGETKKRPAGAAQKGTDLNKRGASRSKGGRMSLAENWTGPPLTKVSVRMTLIARFKDLVDLLGKIQSHAPKIHVGQMRIELVDHAKADLNVSFVLTVFSMEKPEGGQK